MSTARADREALWTHTCESHLPLVIVDAVGQQRCIDCEKAEAWREGYTKGFADGCEMPACPECNGYIAGSGVAGDKVFARISHEG